jgi:hypothetical protein
MGKMIHLTSIMLLLAVAPAVPMAPAQANSGAVNFCQTEILPTLPTANLGECVSYILTSPEGFATHYCDAQLENNPDFFLDFESFADCVRWAHEQVG